MTDLIANTDVVILCGGMGTRLREETEYRPKPMVEIANRPILWHIMKIYSHFGFKRFVLCLGYKGNQIKQYFLNYRAMNSNITVQLGGTEPPIIHEISQDERWSIALVDTGETAMTGARIKRAAPFITSENFMVTYGDGLADIDLLRLFSFHREHGRIGTVSGVRPYSRFGELVVMGSKVRGFAEKPQVDDGFVNGGFFVFRREFLDYLDADDPCVLEQQPMAKIVERGELMVYLHTGFWQCMDTYRDFTALNELWKKGAPWKLWK
jgi:glucose-1-phosphate cytidylyltransferase